MADNYEFVSAVDLPEAEGTNVETLCVENGLLKKTKQSATGVQFFYLDVENGENDLIPVYTDKQLTEMAEYSTYKDACVNGKVGNLVIVNGTVYGVLNNVLCVFADDDRYAVDEYTEIRLCFVDTDATAMTNATATQVASAEEVTQNEDTAISD